MTAPAVVWFRRDLRLTDHAALFEACRAGGPVIPVFIADETVASLGAAASLRLELGLEALSRSLESLGSGLILRKGPAKATLDKLVSETGAGSVHWIRDYHPDTIARDKDIKSDLRGRGIGAQSHAGRVLFEPWTASTKAGTPHKVYTRFWIDVREREVPKTLPRPREIPAPGAWPASDELSDWKLSSRMVRGDAILRARIDAGESAAQCKLARFLGTGLEGALDGNGNGDGDGDENADGTLAPPVATYADSRDFLALEVTSGLSDHLALGEIGPAQCWQAAQELLTDMRAGARNPGPGPVGVRKQGILDGVERFLKELAWREFAYHLMYHSPRILEANWREDWDSFPWREDDQAPEAVNWMRGRTGVEIVDAAMREMYVTGKMHNRGRMIVASYLTKNLLTHWKVGMRWFGDCLADWDAASNAMGWQWTAGSGPDAAPYFRVFSPARQAERFDPDRAYVDRWIAEGRSRPHPDALDYFDAIPRSWNMHPDDPYPAPAISAPEGRDRALAAHREWGEARRGQAAPQGGRARKQARKAMR